MMEFRKENLDLILLANLQQNRVNSAHTKQTSTPKEEKNRQRASVKFLAPCSRSAYTVDCRLSLAFHIFDIFSKLVIQIELKLGRMWRFRISKIFLFQYPGWPPWWPS